MTRHRVLVTDDEREALEAIRPYAASIARARRRWGAGGCADLATAIGAHGLEAVWLPAFWYWLNETVQDARTDPGRMVATLRANDDDRQKLRERAAFAASAEEGRDELERLFAALRGQHRAGRPRGARTVDAEKTETDLYRLAKRIGAARRDERGSVRRATEKLAHVESVTPAAVRKRVTRRLR